MRRTSIAALLFAALVVASGFGLRRLAESPEPVFTVEHVIEIEGDPNEVWQVLADVGSYAEWNPYVLRLEPEGGELAPGRAIRLRIAQANWTRPIDLRPVLAEVDPGRELSWHGVAVIAGLHDTYHVLRIEPITAGRTRLRHFEEFRGLLPGLIHEDETRQHIRAAFQSMNEALAARVEERRSRPRTP